MLASITPILANDCSGVKQPFATGKPYARGMDIREVKRIFAANLKALMDVSPDLKTQSALAKRAKVSQRAVSNYLRPEEYSGTPQLAHCAKLAAVFGIECWQLLHPTMGDRVIKASELALYRRLQDALRTQPPRS